MKAIAPRIIIALGVLLYAAGLALAQTTTVPTATDTVVDYGNIIWSLAGAALMAAAAWIAAKLVPILSGVLEGVGISLTEARKKALQDLVINGIHYASEKIVKPALTSGKLTVDVKSQLVAEVVNYVAMHGGQLLEAMGVSPNSTEFRVAVEARVEKALVDPATPTPAAVTPPEGRPKEVTVVAPAASTA